MTAMIGIDLLCITLPVFVMLWLGLGQVCLLVTCTLSVVSWRAFATVGTIGGDKIFINVDSWLPLNLAFFRTKIRPSHHVLRCPGGPGARHGWWMSRCAEFALGYAGLSNFTTSSLTPPVETGNKFWLGQTSSLYVVYSYPLVSACIHRDLDSEWLSPAVNQCAASVSKSFRIQGNRWAEFISCYWSHTFHWLIIDHKQN